MKIQGCSAIVTGGASGLGEATARMLAHHGAKVAIFDQNTAMGEQAASAIAGIFVRTDVSDDASVTEAIATAEASHGVARLLVNCARIHSRCSATQSRSI